MTAPEPQGTPVGATEQVEPPKTLAEAMLRVQAELPAIEKTGNNPHFKSSYMELDKIMEAALPVLTRNGMFWTTFPGYTENEGRREAILNYGVYLVADPSTAGRMTGHMLLLGAKDNPQGMGAAISYARRQAFCSVFNIVAEQDDDGNRAASAREQSQQRQAEARSGARILSDEQRASMLNQVRESGLDIADTMEKCGIDPDGDVTAAQSRQVRALIEAAKPAGES